MDKTVSRNGSSNHYPLLTKRVQNLRHYNIYRLIFSCAVWLSLLAGAVLQYFSPFPALSAISHLYFAPFFLFTYLSAKTLTHYRYLQGFIQAPYPVRLYRYHCTLTAWVLGLTLCLYTLPTILTIPAILPFIPQFLLAFIQSLQLASFSASLFFTFATFLHHSIANFTCPIPSNRLALTFSTLKPDYITSLEKKGLFKGHLSLFKPILLSDATKLSGLVNNGAISTYPLEIALGFMDLALFMECYNQHKDSDSNFEDSCRRVLVLINNALTIESFKHPSQSVKHDILTKIRDFIVARKSYNIFPVCNDMEFLYPQNDLYHFPSLARTLAYIPLPINTQYQHLNPQQLRRRHYQLKDYSSTTVHSPNLLKQAFDYFTTAFSKVPVDSLTPSFSILKKRIGSKPLNTNLVSQQGLSQLATLLVRMGKYSTLFRDPLSASIALNYPGRRISLQLKRSDQNKSGTFIFALYLGITLVARSLACIRTTEDFLNSLRSVLPYDHRFHQVYADLRKLCLDLEVNIFKHLNQMSTGSTLPRFLLLHGGRKNRPRDIVQNNTLFHGFFTRGGKKGTGKTKRLSVIQESEIVSQALKMLPKHKPLKNTFYQYGHVNSAMTVTNNTQHAISIWSQLETPQLPFWYHCTNFDNAVSILNSNQIDVSHRIFSGAFLSTSIESSYGEMTFALSQQTPLMSNIYNTTGNKECAVWHGCAEPIKLIPHLVAIGYPPKKQASFLGNLNKTGKVHFSSDGNPFIYESHNHRVFLFTNSELDSIRTLFLNASSLAPQDTASKPSTDSKDSHIPHMLPTPCYLVENTLFGQENDPQHSLNPLKSQIDNCKKTLCRF